MNIGILGLGTVGGGVVNVLAKTQAEIERRTGLQIQITRAAVRDSSQSRICPTDGILLTQDAMQIVNDANIDVVLELMGGTDLSKKLVETAMDLMH